MKIIIVALLYGLLFTAIEIVARRFKVNKEDSRKFVHVVAGIAASALPAFMTFKQITILSLLFIPVMLVSKWKNVFSSIHGVGRQTYGEVYFAAAIFITSLAFPRKELYIYGLLIMAISDGFASVVGQHYGLQKYKVFQASKSYIGSATFFVTALIIGTFVLTAFTTAGLLAAIVASITAGIILTAVEAVSPYGLDNLILPPLAALLMNLII
jgi:phytol kinase